MTDTVQLVRKLYADFNARNIDGVLSKLADDVIWANGMDGGHVRGREAVRAYWTTVTPHEDGSVTVEAQQVVRDLHGELLLDETVRHVFCIDNGYVSRFDIGSASQLSTVVHGS
jgi:ketosteroid isomerase-like protein